MRVRAATGTGAADGVRGGHRVLQRQGAWCYSNRVLQQQGAGCHSDRGQGARATVDGGQDRRVPP